uniref:PB1-like domain-containing protein n=1 Tax=Fagus sylvatica TaxID=28930 RepID=A0A2N9H486_FAGSY
MDGHSSRRKCIGGTVLVYDNMEIDLFSVQEIETMCKELGVYNYMQFYYVIPGCDLSDGLRYLSTDSHIIEMSKCLTPLNPKVDVYVEHETPNPLSMDKPIVIRDFSDRSDDDDVGIRLNDDGAGCSGYADNGIEVGNDVSEEEFNDAHVHANVKELWYAHVEEDVVCQAMNGSDVCEHVNDDDNMFLDSDSDDVPFERLYDVTIHSQSDTHSPHTHYPSQPSQPHYPNSPYPIISIDPIDDIPIGSDYGSSDQLNSPNNSDDEPHHIYPDFRATDLDDPVFTVGMYFRDNIELKEAVFAYRLKHGFGLRFTKNERWKVRSVHTCSRAFHSRAVSSRWVAKKYIDHFRINPDMELDELIGKVMKDHEVELSRSKAYRAKQYAKVLIEGSYLEQYRRVRDYCEELMRTNPGTTAKVDVHVPGQQFQEGAVAGQLLAAVGVDGNEGTGMVFCFRPAKRISTSSKKCDASNKWDVLATTGMGPCKLGYLASYAVRAISYKGHNAEDYVDDYFKKKTYLKVYSHLIQPCNGPDFWPIAAGDPILPPIHRRQPGRPKRMHRRRDPDEHQNSHKLKRNQNSLKCGQCHQVGHNKRSCKKKQTMPAGVGQTEARAKGRKNVASMQDETRAKGKKTRAKGKKKWHQVIKEMERGAANTEENSMGFRVPIGMSSQQSNILGSPAAYNSSAPATSFEDTRSRTDIYGVQSSRDKQ